MESSVASEPLQREHAGEFSNYDVLLAKTHLDVLILDPNQNHIGNNRFQIMTNMHREEFDERLTAGEDTVVVVNKIIDIVCRQCEPKGRFMLTQGKGSWIVLNEEEARDFVLEFLTSSPGNPRLTPPDTLTNSLPAVGRSADSEGVAYPPQDLRATMAGDVNSEKKRRRRSSLLRRSVSEGNFDDKKKLGRSLVKFPNIALPLKPSWFPKIGGKTKPEGLDVLFNHNRTKLTTGVTGNNRLAIMIKMQQNAYLSASEEEKLRLVDEVYNTVTGAWKGRFLAETPDKRGNTVLDRQEASRAICCLFDPIGYAAASIDTMPLSIAEDLGEDDPSSTFDLRRPSIVKHKTIEALHKLKPVEDPSGMHNAALASLQKRKQKQNLNSRIRDLTSGNRHTGGVPSTFLHRHTSTPAPMTTFERFESDSSYGSLTPVPLPIMSSSVSLPVQGAYSESRTMDLSAAIGGDSIQELQDLQPDPIMEPRPIDPHRDTRMSMNPIRPSMVGEIDASLIEDLLSHLDVSGDLYAQNQNRDGDL